MKFNSRLSAAVTALRDIVSAQGERESSQPAVFIQQIQGWFEQFILPLYPESPKQFLAVRFLLETPVAEIPATPASCSRFKQFVEKFSYRDRSNFIRSIANLINDLIIHRHPDWLDPLQGDYEYYYCPTTDEVVLEGECGGTLTLSGQPWDGGKSLVPAKRSILVKAGVLLE
ncbi:hypothetical protein H6F67_08700 [Microcoleus sp. FACHB-1515]|uniref:hypothetical protein n=1 Tax=Cyanophyceae TaxID=3028117 RepID=UPI0016824BC0|nr:hypothetical protein [Microcoleus sp. FACHB-1515]MBD2089931.1 hypothetical protein [Microcoleus sp. FACHB-1515]